MTPSEIANQIADRVLVLPPSPSRAVIALAGPPAVGKSTVADATVRLLKERGRQTDLVPMDGFHFDNQTLDALGLRARKGAPETFDILGFSEVVARLSRDKELTVPGFDRSQDAVVPAMHRVSSETDTVVVEGNYLLLDEPEWRLLSQFWTLSVFLSAPEKELEMRLVQRWKDNGFNDAAATAKAERNDLPNARRILANKLPADLEIRT